ncbi:hypothetical protein MMC25_001749 [Agyrium rufum]|nr:hypothetical protein [Agyrium rufum]
MFSVERDTVSKLLMLRLSIDDTKSIAIVSELKAKITSLVQERDEEITELERREEDSFEEEMVDKVNLRAEERNLLAVWLDTLSQILYRKNLAV